MKIRPIFKTIDIFSFIQFLSRQTNYIIKFFLLKVLYLVSVTYCMMDWLRLPVEVKVGSIRVQFWPSK